MNKYWHYFFNGGKGIVVIFMHFYNNFKFLIEKEARIIIRIGLVLCNNPIRIQIC